jgi:hypothetical protein
VDKSTADIINAIEQAAIAGLCIDGQLEIAVQEAREQYPDLDHGAWARIAKAAVYLFRRIGLADKPIL